MGSGGPTVSRHVTNQIDVVVEVTCEVAVDSLSSPAGVFDKLTLGHFVLDVRTAQVH